MNKNFGFSQMGNPFPSMGGMAGGLGNAAMANQRRGAMDDQAKFYATMNDRPKDDHYDRDGEGRARRVSGHMIIRARLVTRCGCVGTMTINDVVPYIYRPLIQDIGRVPMTGTALNAAPFARRQFKFHRRLSEYDAEYVEEMEGDQKF